jgi:hypothetical protein
MSFKTAIDHLETAARIAVEDQDEYREHIALGLIELAKAMRGDLHKIGSNISEVKGKINGLR